MKISERRFLIGLILFNIVVRFWRFWEPTQVYWDERAYYLPAVREIIAVGIDPNFQHPPLAKLLISLSVGVFGDNSFGWRFLPILLSIVAVLAVYFLAKRLFKSKRTAAIAAILLSFEFSWFVIGRVAIPEMFLASFLLISFTLFYSFLQEKSRWRLVLSALFFGLAIASKWTGLILIPLLIFLFFKKLPSKKEAALSLIGFFLTSFIVYISSFLILLNGNFFVEIWRAQIRMLNFHLYDIKKVVPGSEKHQFVAIFWLFDFYPLIYRKSEELVRTIIFMYNPAVVLTALILTVSWTKDWFRKKISFEQGILLYGFLVFWIPFFFSPRVTFPYWWVPGVPFAAIIVANFLSKRWEKDPYLTLGYLVLVIVIFAFYYPLLSFLPVEEWYLKILTGFTASK